MSEFQRFRPLSLTMLNEPAHPGRRPCPYASVNLAARPSRWSGRQNLGLADEGPVVGHEEDVSLPASELDEGSLDRDVDDVLPKAPERGTGRYRPPGGPARRS